MNVLMLNGSCNTRGNTYTALAEIGTALKAEGIDSEIFDIGAGAVRDCIGCKKCSNGHCTFDDDKVNAFIDKASTADGLIFGTPVYYAHPSGRVQSFLDRAFYCQGSNPASTAFKFKPAASVAVARRAGTTASLDVLNKYFGISQMIIVGSTYWTLAHGAAGGEAARDEEGMRTMRNLAHNMAWVLKCLDAGKQNGIALPQMESGAQTSFIR